MKQVERTLEGLLFSSRWILAPFYFGLVIAAALLLVKFGQEFLHVVPHVLEAKEKEVVLAVLSLVDLALIASLLFIIVFSGYESFVSRIETAEHAERPDWMGKLDFSALKIKLFGSIVAISGIELLKVFMNLEAYTRADGTLDHAPLAWKTGIHLVFVVSGVLFAVMDRLAEGKHGEH